MKAIRLSEYGAKLTVEDVAKPTIKDDELLVKIKNTAVNHLDLAEASGAAREIFPIELPWIPGHEFSGIVEQAGKSVKSFKPGDAVFGSSRSGAYAEYIVAKADTLVKKPANLSFAEAASVPVAAQTAWQGIFTHGQLTRGQTILIHGGAGAVGAYAVQLAHHKGARVIVTAGNSHVDFLNSIGADQVIDYKASRFEEEITDKVDVVFDLIGGDTQQRSYSVLKEGGRLIAANEPVSQHDAAKYKATALMMNLVPTTERLTAIAKLLDEGEIKPDIAEIYLLENTAKAWEAISGNLSANKTVSPKSKHGKLIIEIA